MSLFSTIAHPKTTGTTNSIRGALVVVLALFAGMAVGSLTVGVLTSDAPDANAVVGGGLAHEEFLRLNTTDLEYPASSPSVGVVDSAPVVDHFTYWNTTAFDGLAPTKPAGAGGEVSEEFLEWNIGSLEYPPATHPEQLDGPR